MFKIAVCDDDNSLLDQMEQLINQLSLKLEIGMDIEKYHSGSRLISSIKKGECYDIIYMDIEMQGLNGIETSKYIREAKINTIIIFISSYEKYLIELFEVEPFRFIKKPINRGNFNDIFVKALKRVQKQKGYFEYIINKSMKKALFKNIIYFESKQRQIIIHKEKECEAFYGQLTDVENAIKCKTIQFIRIHQSYLVNYNFIESFES